MTDDAFGYVICGGGSAGCVLAARLSARPDLRVALVEAGPDTPPDAIPSDIRASYQGGAVYNPDYGWPGFTATLRPAPHNRPDERTPPRSYEQARVLGGGSSINGQLANRGLPSDYDGWAAEGAAGWSWSEVLPYFRRLERDCDLGGDPLHGSNGPIPIRRIPRQLWGPYSAASAAAWSAAGLPHLPDQNGEPRDGWFALTTSNAPEDHRVSAAMGYLTAGVRARPNLLVLTRHLVLGLEFGEDGRVRGVRVRAPDGAGRVLGTRGEVILSMGALRSPAFLMASGIGPGEVLRDAGVAPLRVLPGVGRNLQDHPTIGIAAYLRRPDRQGGPLGRTLHVGVRFSSGMTGVPTGDMFALPVARSSWHAVGFRLGGMQAWVNRSYSTGRVRIASPDPTAHPVAAFDLLSDARDAARLVDAFRRLVAWHALPPLRDVALDPFPMVYNEAVRKVARRTTRNRALTAILAGILDGPGALRRAAIHGLITEAPPVATLLADEEALEAHVRTNVAGQWHASGTCRMGRADDPDAVTDSAGRVHGVEGLRVCDASLFPFVPSANTNIPVIMVAEKIADAILSGAR